MSHTAHILEVDVETNRYLLFFCPAVLLLCFIAGSVEAGGGGRRATVYHGGMPGMAPTTRASGDPLRDRVTRVINLIRPAVQSDGGDLELVDVTPGGVVRIRLHGACVGCPSSTMTLQVGIERNLKAHVPEVTGVEAVS